MQTHYASSIVFGFLALFAISCNSNIDKAYTSSSNKSSDSIDFNFDVLPILSDRCFQCHGPDENARKADLRLDKRKSVLALGADSIYPVVPGKPNESGIVQRVYSDDPEAVMPPPDSNLKLSETEKEILSKWIEQGGKWKKHWAFIPPIKPQLPTLKNTSWTKNEIDYFVLAKLEELDISPSEEAKPETLYRRVSFDLTGLPPTPEEMDNLLNDPSSDVYEKWVDKLLSSPNFGERWAWEWLDVARYADTNGFQADPTRTMWPWRDWVIDAFNENMPYDEFTTKQIAGDLLPEATMDDILATGFNRNHTYNGEGGRIPEETRVENVFDRMETVGTAWLGLTFNCARCHDHKFDAISQREYYQLFDYFNQTSEPGNVYGSGQVPPVLDVSARYKEKEGFNPEMSLKVMVMDELDSPRQSYILSRGTYNVPLEPVERNVPAVLPPLPDTEENNRLALAKWIVSEDNPLTSRVTVNRYWQAFFGNGLVKTIEDFGVQGALPTHPELLDWLAVDFQQSGWNLKVLFKKIVMSATYRQASKFSEEHLKLDPENRYLARSSRARLPSWMIRDQALHISGLLVNKIGGNPVKTYQPEGIWEEATFGIIKYEQDHGDDLYRRTLYTFWRRIVGPTMLFDNSARQVCTVNMMKTNTPLHALTTLNDITYAEAARVMAEKVINNKNTDEERIKYAFRLGTSRNPKPAELEILGNRLEKLKEDYKSVAKEAKKVISVGEYHVDKNIDESEYAAYSILCSLILNLDETITRQ